MEEGEEAIKVEARAGETILEVALRGGVPLSAPCGGGSCGKCRVRIVRGGMDASRSFYLSEADFAEGWRSACAARVSGDVTLALPEL